MKHWKLSDISRYPTALSFAAASIWCRSRYTCPLYKTSLRKGTLATTGRGWIGIGWTWTSNIWWNSPNPQWNQPFLELFGLKSEELLSNTISAIVFCWAALVTLHCFFWYFGCIMVYPNFGSCLLIISDWLYIVNHILAVKLILLDAHPIIGLLTSFMIWGFIISFWLGHGRISLDKLVPLERIQAIQPTSCVISTSQVMSRHGAWDVLMPLCVAGKWGNSHMCAPRWTEICHIWMHLNIYHVIYCLYMGVSINWGTPK